MWISNFRSGLLTALSAALISGYYSQSYTDLEVLGINCPARDKCLGYRNNLTYMDRSCECDYNCTAYNDCCIDALPNTTEQNSRPSPRTDITCLHYGEDDHSGVYVINKCSNSWSGNIKVRQSCVGADDFSDPFSAAPATDVVHNKTYRNLACARCNNANMDSLKNFQVRLACDGLPELTDEQIMADITYNEQYRLWGVYRLNRFGNGTEFVHCDVIFDVPGYLNDSVRFCRSNLTSTCAMNYNRPSSAAVRLCPEYTAVVYSNTQAYRNPHCALCNYETVNDISCTAGIDPRKRPMSFALLLDVNQSDGNEVGMRTVPTPVCPSNHKYDPFFKKCRQLVCALPGYNVVNGRCVRE